MDIGADPSSVRHWNEALVLRAMRGRGELRISHIAQQTRLTPATVRQVLQGLEKKRWVVASEPSIEGRGRPARLFRITLPDAWTLGLDIGTHTLRAVLLSADLENEQHAEISVDPRRKEPLVGAVREVVAQACTGVPFENVWMTTVAMNGSFDEQGRMLRSVGTPHWEGKKPLETLAPSLLGQTMLTTDIHAACWAEHSLGVAQGIDDVMVVRLGRRPSIGLIMGGKVRHGAHDVAGDLSLHPLLGSGELPAWARTHQHEANPFASALAAAEAGDEQVLQMIGEHLDGLAPAVTLAAAVIDPELIVISGAMASTTRLFNDKLRAAMQSHLQRPPRLALTALDQYAAALGAAHLANREVQRRLVDEHQGVSPLTKESLTRV